MVCSKLGPPAFTSYDHCDQLIGTIELLGFATRGEAKLEEISFDVDRFYSLYGYVTGAENSVDRNSVDIVYAIHHLEFSVRSNSSFSVEEIQAIKDHYSKHQALIALKQEAFIDS